jgi:hypothetical protein
MTTFERAVNQAKDDILDDISKGLVPANVKTFEDLHDHVDANEYLTHDDLINTMGWDDFITFANKVTVELDLWIRAGFPA